MLQRVPHVRRTRVLFETAACAPVDLRHPGRDDPRQRRSTSMPTAVPSAATALTRALTPLDRPRRCAYWIPGGINVPSTGGTFARRSPGDALGQHQHAPNSTGDLGRGDGRG